MPDPHDSYSEDPNERLEAYLDGLLSTDEQQAFEIELANDPRLQRERALQARINESLGRLFVPPTSPVDILELAAEGDTTTPIKELPHGDQTLSSRRRTILLVLAACVAWVVVGWRVFQQATDEGYEEIAMADIYQRCVDRGFRPKWVCEDDREFAETFQRRQGVPLLLRHRDQDVMVGLSYLKGISPQTTAMLARVDGEPVLVFVDRLERDSNPTQPSWGSGLSMFRQELNGLVLYELTPLSEPRVLSSFYVPAQLPPATDETNSTTDEAGVSSDNSP